MIKLYDLDTIITYPDSIGKFKLHQLKIVLDANGHRTEKENRALEAINKRLEELENGLH